ncbi:hypothetical protein LSAT2_001658 [Lamellibrachia satsuma]|nr:hypothetical protein LSAT2_001658 [Lamellibrachia satsuma]
MNETEDQLIETTSMDLCQTPDLASTQMQISDLLSTPPERLDHRMEKEMGESPDLPSLPYSSGMNPREKSKRLGEGFGMWSPTLSNMLSGNYLGEGRSGRSKLRTPRTLTRLMRQHRDSERHRHRGLNATIKEISRKIPGYEDASNETKFQIVKLQRIINYICHVEQRIMCLCEEQGLDLEYKNLFLLPHLPKVTDMRKTGSRSSPGGRSVSSVVTPRTSHRPSRVQCFIVL